VQLAVFDYDLTIRGLSSSNRTSTASKLSRDPSTYGQKFEVLVAADAVSEQAYSTSRPGSAWP